MYRKFFLNLFITCMGVLLILNALNIIYLEKNYYHLYREGTEKFDHVPSEIKIANFGNCYGEIALNYSDIDSGIKETFNFALTGQDSYTDYLLFKNYKGSFTKGSVVLLPVSFYPLYLEEPKYDNNFKSQNMRYYYFMDREYINSYSVYQEILARLNGVKSLFKDIVKSALDIPGNPMLYSNASAISDIEQESADAAQSALSEIRYYDKLQSDSFSPTPKMINSYIDIIELSKVAGLKPVFITTPFYKEFSNQLPDDYYARFHKEVSELIVTYDLIYLDYSRDERIVNNIKYFSDPTHLNYEGSLEFSRILMRDLEDKGIITKDFLAR